ncbi:hypothetical protein Aru02nite_68150 [Actinocatenispora rupis]|uniref:Uncharacterized protein n=1 Tax=Actinocatenispora rupis TaxID=519421 RepID=A0A8J3J521_9ACTN|nr:hypothetical protein Aru02nite_68150 [Actinocatenispora rupis]
MTVSEIAWRAAHDFARRLRDPRFRRFARTAGYRPDRDLVLALEHEPVRHVLDRVEEQSDGGPVTVVVYRPGTERGFSFVEVGDRPAA